MSTLKVDTLQSTGGGATTFTKQEAAKGWISMSFAASSARSDSLNNSSIVDNGTGDFTFTHTNNFNYDGYCTTGLSGGHATADGHWDYQMGVYAQTTSTYRARVYNQSAALRDATSNNILHTGDLA